MKLWNMLAHCAVGGLLGVALVAIFLYAPMEQTMGNAQRILYVHVAVAWLGLLGIVVTAAAGLGYLLRRDLAWDRSAHAAAEIGWLCSGLTLVTGSFWAHAAWDVWWTWDPRLTTSFILWAVYSGYLLIRANIDDPHRRARLAAVLAVVGLLDVPLVVLAAHWFRGMHPGAPAMEPSMRVALWLSVVGFSAFFSLVFFRRRALRCLEDEVLVLRRQIEPQ